MKESIAEVFAKNKKRNFVQTLDLQVTLRDYNPMKDPKINASIDVPHNVRSNQKVRLSSPIRTL